MSIALMTAAWRLRDLSPTQKLVLLSLADNANDQGECYPSMKQISERTGLTDRAVRAAIRSLESAGIVQSSARSGTSTVYLLTIEPRNDVPPRKHVPPRKEVPPTPEPDSAPPRNDVPPTPERRSAKPSLNRQLNRQGTVNRPESVPEGTWADFLAIRTAKRSPLTATALRGIEREAGKAGLTLAEAIAKCCERGWQGFEASWVVGQQPPVRAAPARASPSRQDRISAAVAELTGRSRQQPEIIDVDVTERTA